MLLPAECRDVEPELKLESTDLPLHRDSDKEWYGCSLLCMSSVLVYGDIVRIYHSNLHIFMQ